MVSKSRWINGHLVFYDDPVEKTTAAGTINKYGLTILASSANATYTMGTPEKGITKYLVGISTFTHTVRGASSVGVRFGSTGSTIYSLTLAPTTLDNSQGAQVILRGVSTNQWLVMTETSSVTYSTACT